MKKQVISYSVVAVFTGLLVILVLLIQGFPQYQDNKDLHLKLTNGFFVGGGLMFGFGILAYVSSEGVFDGIKFAFKSMYDRMFNKDMLRYSDYKLNKADNRRPQAILAMVLVGLAFMGISGIFYMLYNM